MQLSLSERKTFNKNLRRYMKEADLTIEKAAKLAGVPVPTMGSWRRGTTHPCSHQKAAEVLAKLALKPVLEKDGRPIDIPKPTETTAAAVRRVAREANRLINTTGVKASVNPDGSIRFGMTIWYE